MTAKKSDDHHIPRDEKASVEEESQALSEVDELQQQLQAAKDAELRARADYHNLVRRTQEERLQLIKLATKGLVNDLVHPLDHLSLAARQLQDKGLDMVITELWKVLEHHGLKEINPLGKPFDIHTMDAVDFEEGVSEDEAVVVNVVKTGYELNGEVIQHAKVGLGKKS